MNDPRNDIRGIDACWSINRKKRYFTIYNNQTRYPLQMIQEYKAINEMSYQQVANELLVEENKTRQTNET